MLTISLFN